MSDLFNEVEMQERLVPQQVFAGVIATNAVDHADRVDVVIPGLTQDLRWEECRWQARDNFSLPQRGNQCVVVMDDNGELWVVSWSNNNPTPGLDTWHNLTFSGNWSNYGSGYAPAQCTIQRNLVIIRGLVTRSGGNPSLNEIIGTAPIGYRTSSNLIFSLNTESNGFCTIHVLTNGQIQWIRETVTGGSAQYVSLSGIQYMIY